MEPQTIIHNQPETSGRFAVPVKLGLIAGLLKIIISTIQYQFFSENLMVTGVIVFLSFTVGVIFLFMTGVQQRKTMGGFIEIKQAFQAIFVAILIIVTLNYLYDLIYQLFIDPGLADRIQAASMSMAENLGTPEESLDEMRVAFEEKDISKLGFADHLLAYFTQIVWYSIIGFICAAIVKKKRPLTDM